jgi:methylenetetrahydrofolate dehydrogenase (NAD+)
MAPSGDGKGVLLKAAPLASAFADEIRSALATPARAPPTLVGILATAGAPSRSYAEATEKQCAELGVRFMLRTTGAALGGGLAEGEGVEEAIIEANEDDSVNGIMVRGACRDHEQPPDNGAGILSYLRRPAGSSFSHG